MSQDKQKIFYTYSYDGGDYDDYEFESHQKAQDHADTWFEEYAGDHEMATGEEREIEIIGFYYDDDGDRVIVETHPSCVIFENYHGDYAEHNTHWGL